MNLFFFFIIIIVILNTNVITIKKRGAKWAREMGPPQSTKKKLICATTFGLGKHLSKSCRNSKTKYCEL